MNERILTEIARVADTIAGGREERCELPSKEEIIACLEKLRCILFPGFFEIGEQDSTVVLLREVASGFLAQIELARRQGPECGTPLERDAEDIVLDFVRQIPKIKEYLSTDIEALYQGDPAAYSRCEIILAYPGLYAAMVYRVAHELHVLNVPMIPRLMTEYAHSVTGIDIHPGAKIGKYFCMDHGTGIVIGETTEIGDHVKLYQGVTLGALSTKDGQGLKQIKRHPTILDHVTIYSGATILGGNTVIGEHAVIGGNTFIVKSVPGNTSVRMVPPELQYKES